MAVPGLFHQVQLLAWTHRREAPIVYVTVTESDVDGTYSEIRIQIVPRSSWERNPNFLTDEIRESVQVMIEEPSFHRDKSYIYALVILREDRHEKEFSLTFCYFTIVTHGAHIVEALTSGTRAEDLADAFAWIQERLSSDQSQKVLQIIMSRALSLHGCTNPYGAIPAPTQALNNEVAFLMMDNLDLEFEIRLKGLQSAAHLNGREGVIRGQDPTCLERWTARLDDGACVSMKASNFVHIRRGDYKRKSP
jgi:hypothetical protein